MAIKLANPETRPAMVMDGLHVDQLLLRIDRLSGIKSINAQGVTYGIDTVGKQIYSDKNIKIADGDFSRSVVAWAIKNGVAVDPTDAVTKLQTAKAKIDIDKPDIFTLMAYFEQAIGSMFEITGKADVAGIE